MNSNQHQRAKEIFLEACDLNSAERTALLERLCGSDGDLRAAVERLLAHDNDPGGFERGAAVRTHLERMLDPAAASSGQALRTGSEPLERIEGYQIIDILGEGGFGTVYRAEQSVPVRRTVALKVLKPGMDSRAVISRFNAERQALAALDHPSFARVFDAGQTETGRPYFAMELVPGAPITAYCSAQRLTMPARLDLFIRVCHAVQHAHQKGLIHRDIKPSNVLIVEHENQPAPKLIDFGIARALDSSVAGRTLVTEAGQLIGTPDYMSPEQAAGEADIDTRSDIYSLGVVLYELLTGTTPLDRTDSSAAAAGPLQLQRMICELEPPAPSTRLRTLGQRADAIARERRTDASALSRLLRGDLDWIVMRALEKDRARRYETADALATDVQRYLKHEPVVARPPTAAYKFRKFARRNRAALAAAGGMLVLLIGGTIGTSVGMFQALAARDSESKQHQRADAEARTAREVTDFVTQDLLGAASPYTKGKDVSMRQVVDQAAASIEGRFPSEPLVEAGVRAAVGRIYTRMALFAQAEPHLQKAYEIRMRELGPENPETLDVGRELALEQVETSHYAEAETLFKQLLAADRAQRPNHESVVLDLTFLSRIYRRLDRAADAERTYREALETQTRREGPNHDHTMAIQAELAGFLRSIGRLDEAAPLLEQALDVQMRTIGPDHPVTLAARSNLASLYQQLNRLDESESIFDELLPAMRRVFGPEHPNIFAVSGALGVVYEKQGRLADAERVYVAQLAGLKRVVGEENVNTLIAEDRLVEFYVKQERWAEAEPLCCEALTIRERTLGADNKQTQEARSRLTRICVGQGRVPGSNFP